MDLCTGGSRVSGGMNGRGRRREGWIRKDDVFVLKTVSLGSSAVFRKGCRIFGFGAWDS